MPRVIFLFVLLTSLIVFNPAAFTSPATAAEIVASGDLSLTFTQSGDGAALTSIADKAAGRELVAQDRVPFFEIILRKAGSQEDVSISSDAGWSQVEIVPANGDKPFTIRWSGAKRLGSEAADFCVTARAALDPAKNRISWNLEVDSGKEQKTWAIHRVLFPQVALADLGPESELLFPRGAGEVKRNPCAAKLDFGGAYPGGWTTMQLMAYYLTDVQAEYGKGESSKSGSATGLYFSLHDPLGGTKKISADSRQDGRSLVLKFDHPAENMNTPGNRFSLSGQAVWQLLRGDWFDAATVYREWVEAEAEWYPRLTAAGRADTPQWMRELPVWVMTGGSPETVVPAVEKFAKAVGVPVGVHWYSWHVIPFDNDYPHYFPAKPGFAEAVARLQAENVYVMPYINGRLWDSRDRGIEDFQFTSVALPATTKDESGKPILESYGSKESDGEPVRLGVMCPTTPLWQDKIRETALRLMNECGTGGVYIDQVAAAEPVLCFDGSHGHPIGGGHWWTAGYWQYLDRLREKIPTGHIITTECNAEPFVKWFDGYLTWHWQYDDQQPVFPAVYGGAVQMFGRAYRGELNDNDLATHMKAAQQLVYGEQIGWFDPGVIDRARNAAFIKQIVALRWHLRRYFYAGRMGRPPRPLGDIPKVRANWRWTADWWVENPAILTGAWRLPDENRAVFFAINVSDQPITARAVLDLADYGLKGEELQATHLTVGESMNIKESVAIVPRLLDRELTIPPKTAWAWEVK